MKCVYCLKSVQDATEDHVVARSWFPDSTPDNIEKWKVPSCRPCNNRYSQLEEDLRTRLAFCVDPNDPASEGIYERAQRSLDPSLAKNPTDQHLRRAKKRKIYRDIIEFDTQPQGVLPFSSRNFGLGSRLGILIPRDLNTLVDKWARGLHFNIFERYIEDKGKIDIIHADDDLFNQATAPFIQHATILEKGPGIEIMYLSAHEEKEAHTFYRFNIWSQFRACASVVEQISKDDTQTPG